MTDFTQTLPGNTVIGRLSATPGPAEALPFSAILTAAGASAAVVGNVATLRLLSQSTNTSASTVGHTTQLDGGAGTYSLKVGDTSGWRGTATISGTAMTIVSTTDGSLAIGQAINLSSTGVTLAYITAGSGSSWTISASLTYSSATAFTADNNGTFIVAADGGRWFLVNTERVNIEAFGCDATGVIPCDYAFQSALNSGFRLKAGVGNFNLAVGVKVPLLSDLEGAGMGKTVFTASAPMTTMLDMTNSTDTVFSPITLRDFKINGNSLATNGYNLRYAHNTEFENIDIEGCTNAAQEKDAWLSRRINVRYSNNTNGLWLVGSNHSSSFVGCTMAGNTSKQLLIQSNGTAADGNMALTFTSCDIEFGSGDGVDITATSVNFDGCYIGEGISGTAIINRGGTVNINGGQCFFGYSASTYLISPIGGKTVFRGAQIAGQTYGAITTLVNPATPNGKFAFYDVDSEFPVGGTATIPGDCIDYGPQGTVYSQRLGKSFTGEGNNITFSSVVTGNYQTFTVLTAPGPTPLLGCYSALSNHTQWRDGEVSYLVVVYQSSQPCTVKISAAGFGGSPSKTLGNLPATSGTWETAIFAVVTLDALAYGYVEINQDSSAVNDYIQLSELILSDSRMAITGPGNLSNLYKC